MEHTHPLAATAGTGTLPLGRRTPAAVGRKPGRRRSPWWEGAPWLALLLILVGAVRLHELLPQLRILQPALLTTFGGAALLLLKSPPRARRLLTRHTLMRLVLAYWGFMAVTVPLAMYSGQALGIVKYFLPALVLVAAILACAPVPGNLRRLQLGMVVATGAYAAYVMLFGSGYGGRLDAGLGAYDSNDMAALLALVLPLGAGLIRVERGWIRAGIVAITALLVVTAVASGSRGGALGLGAGAVVFVLGMRGSRRLMGVGVLVVSALLVWNFSPSFQERMISLTNLEEDYNLTHEYGRKAVWARGRQYIRENPVIGVGAGNFPIAEGEYFAETYSGLRGGKWSAAHNSYVQAFAELGMVGGSIFVALLVYGFRHAWRLWRGGRVGRRVVTHRPEFLASLAAYLVSAVFLSHAYFIPMLALLGLIALASAVADAERKAYRALRRAPPQSPGLTVAGPRPQAVLPGSSYRGRMA